jgi:hypothetical protein
VRSRWFSGRVIALHTTVLVVVFACLALGWWQLERALSGNTLSWVYTFEWPFFAAYAIFMWWRLLHEEPGSERRSRSKRRRISGSGISGSGISGAQISEQSRDEEEKLAEYNRYLADLHASDESRRN